MRLADHELPVLGALDDVVDVVATSDRPVYVRFSPKPPSDEADVSVDHVSGLRLPGLPVNPISPPAWWVGRSLEDWVRRQICTSAHLRHADSSRACWLVTGREVGRGPDNEPLLGDVRPLATISADVVAACGKQAQSTPAPWQGAAEEPARRGLFDRIEQRLVSWSPGGRRRAAVQTFVWSVVLMVVNSALYIAGIIDESDLIFVTLVLSWLAITFTAADLVATTDVRKAEEEPDGNVDRDG
jgi:hypothetical protein